MKTEPTNIAFVNYHNPIFWPFFDRIRSNGFKVFWINSRPITSAWMRSHHAPPENICDVLEEGIAQLNIQEAAKHLKEFERNGLPTINSIIFMDQNLRRAKFEDAIAYLAQAAMKIEDFIVKNHIEIVSSGRDTALQLLTMLICKKLGVWWGCVTRPKLPKNRFGFSPTHQGDVLVKLRDVTSTDIQFAEAWLSNFRRDVSAKPFARAKIKPLSFINKLWQYAVTLCVHLRHIVSTQSTRKIPGSNIKWHLTRYLNEFNNYMYYRLFLRFDRPDNEPFVLYGLHRQPESSIDVRGAFYDDQMNLIKQIIRSLPLTHKLYVKVHFSDVAGHPPVFYRKLRSFPNLKLIDPDIDSRSLIEKAAVIVTNVGAMGQEGGYLGRPVIAMSKMFWASLPTVYYCPSFPELPDLIHRLISSPPLDNPPAIVKEIAGYVANSFPCDPNLGFMKSTFSMDELHILSEAYDHIRNMLFKNETGT